MKCSLLSVLFVVMSCFGQKAANLAQDNNKLQLLLTDNYGGGETERFLVIRSQKKLNLFLSEVNKTRKPGLTLPKMDFSKEMAIVYCTGAINQSTKTGIHIAHEDESSIFMTVQNKKPKGEARESTAIATPFYIYRLPLTNKEIRFGEAGK